MTEKMAEKWNIHLFRSSNGGFYKLESRQGIQKKQSVESGFVDVEDFEQFKESLKVEIAEYGEKSVFNCDETGLFYKSIGKKYLTAIER